jgi:hypothetical protein
MSIEIISALAGLILTLMVFSYLLGDNPLFRIAIYLFIGVASGYAAAVTWHSVLLPRLTALPLTDIPQLILGVIPFIFAVSLLFKISPRSAWIGNFAMAILVGVGAAAAIGGAVIGTLLPQTQASMNAFDVSMGVRRFFEAPIALAATVLTLASFHYSASRAPDGTVTRNRIIEMIASLGRIFVAITLGVLFAGVYMAALTAMIERLSSIIDFIRRLSTGS